MFVKGQSGFAGRSHSGATRVAIKENNAKYWLGKTHSEATKEKIRAKRAVQVITPESRSKAKLKMTGEQHPLWKGEGVGYGALHRWVTLHKGAPSKCESCGLEDKNRVYDWANVDHQYNRDLDDFIRLCRPCHRKHDYSLLLGHD